MTELDALLKLWKAERLKIDVLAGLTEHGSQTQSSPVLGMESRDIQYPLTLAGTEEVSSIKQIWEIWEQSFAM